MNRPKRIICGIALVVVAVLYILNLSGVLSFNLLFKGWWTLIIIIPCFFGLINDKNKIGPLFGIGIGVILMLCCRNIVDWEDLLEYAIVLFALAWGLAMIMGKDHGKGHDDNMTYMKDIQQSDRDGLKINQISCSFGGRKTSFAGEKFEGADIKLSFGALALDLRGADLTAEPVLNIDCSFAGMEILVDPDVMVRNEMQYAFGGVEDKRRIIDTPTKTIHLQGKCSFAGIEIK